MKAFSLTLLFLTGMLMASSELKQAEIEALLPGKWLISEKIDSASLEVVTTYGKDRSYTTSGVIKTKDREIKYEAAGTWSVSDNVLIINFTSSSHPQVIPVGTVEKDVISAIDKKTMTYKDENGDEATETRVEP